MLILWPARTSGQQAGRWARHVSQLCVPAVHGYSGIRYQNGYALAL